MKPAILININSFITYIKKILICIVLSEIFNLATNFIFRRIHMFRINLYLFKMAFAHMKVIKIENKR